jgi:hypothetical protein
MEVAGRLNTAGALEHAVSNYGRAAEAVGNVASEHYLIAGSRVTLRFASPPLRDRLTPAFAHLAAPDDGGFERLGLTVHLWDSVSTGIEPLPLPPASSAAAVGELHHLHEPPLRAAYRPQLRTLSMFDSEANTAWHWVEDAFRQPPAEQACPIRQILFWWLASREYLQLHGAAVGTPEGGVLVAGQPGSGKSTVALACVGSELLYAGDDYVAAALEPRPHVASLYNSAKVEPEHIRQGLPHLAPLLAGSDLFEGEKAVVYVHEHLPGATTTGFGLDAIVVPRFDPGLGTPRFVEISRAEAFAALGPSTIVQLHTGGKRELAEMSSLVARLPCYALAFGPDLQAIPAAMSALVSDLSAGRDD